MKSRISTHVLDTALGKPAAGMKVVLERFSPDSVWEELARGETDADGRINALLPSGDVEAALPCGAYRLTFHTGAYFRSARQEGFYPSVAVVFELKEPLAPHYHVPLLLSPFGYSTYRGS